ncbi:MAG: hypothetical protein KJP23_01695 [Deltaproteobacteria bacterium]|nr:hypothetical protein [Deltaproteobacteria bacterium]
MMADGDRISIINKSGLRNLIFPGCVLAIYAIVFVFSPTRAAMAFGSSIGVLLKLMLPLSLVIVLMVLMNLFLGPPHIVRFLGQGSGNKGIFLSAAAGIISIGPIYAWYPMLKELREIGAKNSLIAVFLGNRRLSHYCCQS